MRLEGLESGIFRDAESAGLEVSYGDHKPSIVKICARGDRLQHVLWVWRISETDIP